MLKFKIQADNIQALCEMEEYVKIIFIEIWFKPPRAPVKDDKIIKTTKNKFFNEHKRIRGATFCHENKIRAWIQDKLEITCGNQKCRGAKPVFSPKAIESKNSEDIKRKFS